MLTQETFENNHPYVTDNDVDVQVTSETFLLTCRLQFKKGKNLGLVLFGYKICGRFWLRAALNTKAKRIGPLLLVRARLSPKSKRVRLFLLI